jgi:hypothetical protein
MVSLNRFKIPRHVFLKFIFNSNVVFPMSFLKIVQALCALAQDSFHGEEFAPEWL